MARKPRQRISYVLPLANSPGGHLLGVNSLTVDNNGILYSAGRDGMICSWNLNIDLNRPTYTSEHEFIPRQIPTPSTFRAQTQAHTHWVNDISLCHSNQVVVSASSDLTVKLWRPHSAEQTQPETIGVHSDYVKCLAVPEKHSGWVASGGLDRKIKIWDMNEGTEKLHIDVGEMGKNPKGSIYSLGFGGGILASGGPEGVVRVWDPRSGKRVTKFVGHTDNVRAILVDESGGTVLTASSDTTIKMWSITAGRCIHTFTMHNDSVWSLHSSHPELRIFHSSDRSGLVAKTDVRNVEEIDQGICVAICQEQEGVNKVVASGDYLWTATQSSSINRWLDVDTNIDIGAETKRPRVVSNASLRRPNTSPSVPGSPTSLGPKRGNIPLNSLLRLSSTSAYIPPTVRDPDAVTVYSIASAKHETPAEGVLVPVNDLPDETIEGQHGLIKHLMLNDRRRVLTLDTAGDVMMWDLLKCIPVQSFGKRHLEHVAAEINTVESVANWCQLDTRTGRLACVLEQNYCFDAETYADEMEFEEEAEFRDDQRINLGKWILRYLFNDLIDEEMQRDEAHRAQLDKLRQEREAQRRANDTPMIALPNPTSMLDAPLSPGLQTPKSTNGFSAFPQTPGMSIGLATPAAAYHPSSPPHSGEPLPPIVQEGRLSADYFSSMKSGPSLGEACDDAPVTPSTADKDKEEKGSGFIRWRSFGSGYKKLARSASTDMGQKTPALPEEKLAETEEPVEENKPDPLEDTLGGVIKKLRTSYETAVPEKEDDDDEYRLKTAVTLSLPTETPVLRPPSATTIIVQEDRPDSGGVADLYRGTVGCVGEDADLLERVCPAWLGELLLLNKVPFKEIVKVSFVLMPWKDELPVLPSETGSDGKNSRLNANRMLRAKKIIAYVAERLQPPFMNASFVPEGEGSALKPENWLELICHDQIVPGIMTLATMKSHLWKTHGDIYLYYRRKEVAKREDEKDEKVGDVENESAGSSSTAIDRES
ncbi:hypothetical protein RUND412_006501 [Rhizina undulata]